MKVKLIFVVLCLLAAACININSQPTEATPPDMPDMPNPASAYCVEQGYKSEIRTASDGSQSGVCIFSDGSECDEWAYYRAECAPAGSSGSMPNPASAYCAEQGYISEIRTASDGSQSGVCIFPDGSECDEWAYYRAECASADSSGSMPNPASAYCVGQGYKSEIRTASDGSQGGVCIFPDASECDEWAYFRAECSPAGSSGSMPNPASAYCVEQGYMSEIRTASDGSQSGVCIFPDGTECDEWAYFRGECKPGDSLPSDSDGWKIYTNKTLGYSFHYPAGVEIIISDEPKKSLIITGPGMGTETWGISHPGDMDEFRPPEGVDLYQWLSDHYLLGELRKPDEQIAGITAVHFRHEGSPQSPADDRYYFAKAGQLYMILIGHSSASEDWDFNNRFLQSFKFNEPASSTIPTALPIDPSAYQDWQTYTNPTYNFTLRLPDDWTVDDSSLGDPLLAGHEIILRTIHASQKQAIRITFRRVGEDTPLWPTGVGQGEFIPQGTLDIAGQPAQRVLLVCPTGEVTSIWYHQAEGQPNILRGEMEFGFIFSAAVHCEPGYSLSGETQQVGETIIASLAVP